MLVILTNHFIPNANGDLMHNMFMFVWVFFVVKVYRKVSNIRRTPVGNKIVDHSDVVGASPVGASPTTFILDLIYGFKGFGKDSRKTV